MRDGVIVGAAFMTPAFMPPAFMTPACMPPACMTPAFMPPAFYGSHAPAWEPKSAPLQRRIIRRSNSSRVGRYAQYVHIDACMLREENSMRTTLNIEDALIEKAALLTGITEKTSLVRLGLQALIARESSKRLALLGGSENSFASP